MKLEEILSWKFYMRNNVLIESWIRKVHKEALT